MKLLMFLGHHKVGSSALQTYLGRNALALLRRDILYPAVEGQGLATLLAMALGNPDGRGPDWPAGLEQPVNLREAHNALAFAMLAEHRDGKVPVFHEGLPPAKDMLRIISRQVETFAPDVMILASEVMSNFGRVSPKLIRRLMQQFGDADVTFSVTLRRIDEYLVSWHAQRLRFGQNPRSLPSALERYSKTIHFNYRKVIEPWMTACPDADLRLRTYDQVRAAGGSVQDFMGGFGLPMPEDPATLPRVNESLHRAFFRIAHQANATLDPAEARNLFHILLTIGSEADLPVNRDIEMFGAEARAFMVEQFEPIHAWLGEVSGQAPFFEDGEKIGALLPVSHAEATAAALSQLKGPLKGAFSGEQRQFLATITP